MLLSVTLAMWLMGRSSGTPSQVFPQSLSFPQKRKFSPETCEGVLMQNCGIFPNVCNDVIFTDCLPDYH